MILSFDVSPTSQCLSFGDAAGSIHLMSTNNPEPQFNTFSRSVVSKFFNEQFEKFCIQFFIYLYLYFFRPTEFADPVETLQPFSSEDNETPLSSIPMTYTGQTLFSDWPEEFLKKVYR